MRPPATALLALVLLLAAAAAAPASGAVSFGSCPGDREGRCGRVTVPLDHSGKTAGTTSLRVLKLAARSGRAKGTLFAEAGGPGDGAVEYFTRRRDVLETVRDRWDVIVVDQRGTGASGLVNCAPLQAGGDAATAVPACAAQLGTAKNLYTTAASADDIDDVRSALGLRRISLYGLSYGTWLAQTYAKRHPDRVERLILDGVVSREQQDDPFLTGTFRSLPRVMRATCGAGACKGVTEDPWADLQALTRRAAAGPIAGTLVDDQGRPQTLEVSLPLVVAAFQEADLNPGFRAQEPAAVRRALDGDPRLLLRLVDAGNLPEAEVPTRFSVGVNTATNCEEKGLPWARTTPQAQRLDEARRRLEKIPESRFAPVPRALILLYGIPVQCQYWPNAPMDPLERGKLPDVPALILNGDADLRTTLESAKTVAKALPRSQLVTVPNVGHNTLSSALTACARTALAAFLDGGKVKRCAKTAFRAVPAPPATLGAGAAARLSAAVLTVDDAVAQIRLRLRRIRAVRGRVSAGGLLGGTMTGTDRLITLAAAELVPGLKVSGTVTTDGTGSITLAGAVSGTLKLGARRVTGALDGAKVDAPRPRSAY